MLLAGAGGLVVAGGGTTAALLARKDRRKPSRELRATLTGDFIEVLGVAFSPDGKSLASTSLDGSVRLWDLAKPHPVSHRMHDSHTAGSPTAAAFSPDGKDLAVAMKRTSDGSAGFVTVWKVATRDWAVELDGLGYWANAVTYSGDGTMIVAASDVQDAFRWSTGPTPTRHRIPLPVPGNSLETRIWCAASRPQTDGMVALAREDAVIDVVDLHDQTTSEPYAQVHTDDGLTSVAFSADGTLMASCGSSVQLWRTAKLLGKPRTLRKDIPGSSLAFAPDGRILVVGSSRSLCLFDVQTGRLFATLTGHTATVSSVAFSPDGKTIASGSADYTVRLWDVPKPTT
jgi:WD40 repeat protein